MSEIKIGVPPSCPICFVSSGSTHPSNCPNYGELGPNYSHAGPPPLTLCNKDGSDVLLFEGSRLEWDVLAGIAIPGAGTCAAIGQSFPVAGIVDAPPVCIQIDPNEKLRMLAAKVRSEPFVGMIRNGLPSGLDGEGGFIIMAGDAIWRGVQDGTIRVLNERRAPETYKPAMVQWSAEYKKTYGSV